MQSSAVDPIHQQTLPAAAVRRRITDARWDANEFPALDVDEDDEDALFNEDHEDAFLQ